MEKSAKRYLESWLPKLFLWVAVVILILLPIHAFLSTWAGSLFGTELIWKTWKEILLTVLVPFVALYCWLKPDITKLLWGRLINKLIVAYVGLHVILSLWTIASSEAVLAGLLMNLRFLAIFVLVQIIVTGTSPTIKRLHQFMTPWLLWTAIGLSVLAIVQVTFLPKDFLTHFGYGLHTIAPFTLVDENPNALRAFATMRGPNTLGAYLLLPLAIALYSLYKKQRLWLSGVTLGLGLIALGLTGSRSAWLGFVSTVIALGLLMVPRSTYKQWLRRIALPGILVVGLLSAAAISIPVVRLALFHSSPSDSHLLEGSTEQHWIATVTGALSVVAHPLGQGVGSAGPASFYNTNDPAVISENYFVQIAEEVGLLGLILFLLICLSLWRQLRSSSSVLAIPLQASFVGLSLTCLFLHTWADDPTAMTWWALAGLAISLPTTKKREPS
jgi:hypothetical protein